MSDFDFHNGTLTNVKQFDEQNGDDGIDIDGWFCFSNGARREIAPWGAQIPPPSDPLKRCRAKVRYHEALLEDEIQEFREFRHQLLELTKSRQADHLGPPPREELQKLKTMKAEIESRKALVEKLQAKVNRLTPSKSKAKEDMHGDLEKLSDKFHKKVRDTRI